MGHTVRLASPLFESFHDLTTWINGLVNNPIPDPDFDGYVVDEVLQVRAVRTNDTMYAATVFLSVLSPVQWPRSQTLSHQSRSVGLMRLRASLRRPTLDVPGIGMLRRVNNKMRHIVERASRPQLTIQLDLLPVQWWLSRFRHTIELTFSRQMQRVQVQKVRSHE